MKEKVQITTKKSGIVTCSYFGIGNGTSTESLQLWEEKGICVSAGSACASNKPSVSATLKAIGGDKEKLESTVRFSFSVYTTKDELDYTLKVMYDKIPMLRKYTRKR